MKLGIIADVHCQDRLLLLTVRELVSEGVDEILLAGDAIYEDRLSNGVIEIIREYGIRFVQGNHESALMSDYGLQARSAPHVRQANLDFIGQTPAEIRTTVDGKSLLMVHGSPWSPSGQYLFQGDPQFDRCDELGVDYLILGHTHMPMVARHGRTLVINPGSLAFSNAGDIVGDFAILDTTTDEVTIRKRTNPSFIA